MDKEQKQHEEMRARKQSWNKETSLKQKSIKYTLIGVCAIVVLISGFLWYVYYGPRWGTMYYGVCKVFAERYVDFPQTMKVRDVDYWRQSDGWNARVYISHIDASGQFNYNSVECFYKDNGGLSIHRVRIDRRPYADLSEDPAKKLNPDILNKFNKSLDAILFNPPSLLLPRSPRDASLSALWRGEG